MILKSLQEEEPEEGGYVSQKPVKRSSPSPRKKESQQPEPVKVEADLLGDDFHDPLHIQVTPENVCAVAQVVSGDALFKMLDAQYTEAYAAKSKEQVGVAKARIEDEIRDQYTWRYGRWFGFWKMVNAGFIALASVLGVYLAVGGWWFGFYHPAQVQKGLEEEACRRGDPVMCYRAVKEASCSSFAVDGGQSAEQLAIKERQEMLKGMYKLSTGRDLNVP